MVGIKELEVDSAGWEPGEVLDSKSEYFHVTITYNVSGERYVVDDNIDEALKSRGRLRKVGCVNTTLYEQLKFDDELTVVSVRIFLKKYLKDIFAGSSGTGGAEVSIFCMFGNFRGFAFEIS